MQMGIAGAGNIDPVTQQINALNRQQRKNTRQSNRIIKRNARIDSRPAF